MNRVSRISEAWGLPPSSRADHGAPAAESDDLQRSAAFSYNTESCPPSPPGGQVRTAPDAPPPASGADSLLTQSSAAVEARAAHNREVAGSTPASATSSVGMVPTRPSARAGSASDEIPASHSQSAVHPAVTAPAVNPKPIAQAGAVKLSDASVFILSLVAAHEGRAPQDILSVLIAGAAEAIGIHSLIMRDAADIDLIDVPAYARRAANRFRGGGP